MILDGQLIHASVAFKPKDYEPEANFAVPLDWSRIVGKVAVNDGQYDALSWPRDLEPRLEKDLFDESFVQDTLNDFIKETDKFKDILPQLSFMALVGTPLLCSDSKLSFRQLAEQTSWLAANYSLIQSSISYRLVPGSKRHT